MNNWNVFNNTNNLLRDGWIIQLFDLYCKGIALVATFATQCAWTAKYIYRKVKFALSYLLDNFDDFVGNRTI